MFPIYFPIGFGHIVSVTGADHLLFIIVLCAVYTRQEWRRVLVLLTGFTLGHSLTLALTALQLVSFSQKWVELLIPCTILTASVANIVLPKPVHLWRPFVMASLFGLVHGCGFAGYFIMMLGDEQSVLGPLFAFNLGLEAGQLVVVSAYFGLYYALEIFHPIPLRRWTLFVSGLGAALALKLML